MVIRRTALFALTGFLAACASEQDPGLGALYGDPNATPPSGTASGGASSTGVPSTGATGGAVPSPMGGAGAPTSPLPATTDGGATSPGQGPPPPAPPPAPTDTAGGPDPFAAPPACTSNAFWTRNNSGSSRMRPGGACIDCHSRENEAPRFSIAGTVYPTGHEPNDCNGTNGGTGAPLIIVTGADGATIEIPVNSVGNFYYEGRVALPYTTSIRNGNNEIPMVDAATNGDCNTCHDQNGTNGAPGRIVPPPP